MTATRIDTVCLAAMCTCAVWPVVIYLDFDRGGEKPSKFAAVQGDMLIVVPDPHTSGICHACNSIVNERELL
jgi:hypothetical protein